MSTPRPPGLNRPGSVPPLPALLRRSWGALAAAAVLVAALVLVPVVLSGMDRSVPLADRDLTPSCASLTGARPELALPAGVRALDGQFAYQTGSSGSTTLTFTAVPGTDLAAVLGQVSAALRAGGYTVTEPNPPAPLAQPVRGYDRLEQQAVLTAAGPAGRGTITVSGRCTDQFAVAYVLTR
ncbi:MAG TPA: hypothetical protein VMU51_05635 [Mycobacteriales bacterium]|nr:hypothetical protein [Mycobacteriales bacterium]